MPKKDLVYPSGRTFLRSLATWMTTDPGSQCPFCEEYAVYRLAKPRTRAPAKGATHECVSEKGGCGSYFTREGGELERRR